MKFHISANLSIEVITRHKLFKFTLKPYRISITLSHYQFTNLHDVITARGPLSPDLPLGNGMWLTKGRTYRLHSHGKFISFDRHSWEKYKYNIHPRIRSFLRHTREHEGRQRHARDVTRSFRRFKHRPSSHTKKQVLQRSPPNVDYPFREKQEGSNVSLRQNSDVGKTFSFRASLDALQNTAETAKNIPEAPSYETDIEKYGSVCTIEDNC